MSSSKAHRGCERGGSANADVMERRSDDSNDVTASDNERRKVLAACMCVLVIFAIVCSRGILARVKRHSSEKVRALWRQKHPRFCRYHK